MQNHLLLHVARSGGAAVAVDVGAIRIDADRHDLGTEFVEHGRRDTVGRPMGTVDHDLETVQAKTAREAMFDELDVTSRRSEEHTSELQSLMRISYAVFCFKKKNYTSTTVHSQIHT